MLAVWAQQFFGNCHSIFLGYRIMQNQKYDRSFDQVWLGNIRPGMTRSDVMLGLQQMAVPPMRDFFYRPACVLLVSQKPSFTCPKPLFIILKPFFTTVKPPCIILKQPFNF